jgi:signal peptidase
MALSRIGRRAGVVLSSLSLGVAVLAYHGQAVGQNVFAYRTVTMLTGSMSPTINPGDVVISVPEPAAQVAVGDVLTYAIPVGDRRVETHRVTEVGHDAAGRTTIVTKGDANAAADPWTATVEGDTVWETKAVVSWAGTVIRALREPTVHGVLLWGAVGALALLGIWQIWAPERGEDDA